MLHYPSSLLSVNQAIENFLEKRKKFLFLAITLAYISCAMNLPVSIYTLAGHDDALFMSHAYNILKGEWLGNYSQMTLAKGAGYALFLAANVVFGVPITLSIALFYAFSVWLLTEKIIQLGLPKLAAVLFFIFLLFHPQIFPIRIIRDNIYPALSLLVFTAFIDLCLLNQRGKLILAFYGCIIALFWITREEGIWITPAITLLILFKITSDWKKDKRDNLISFFKGSLLLALFISLPLFVICSINYMKYGAFLTVDFKEHAFSKSLSLLNSIETDIKVSHVPVNKTQREIAYSVSPSFAELKPYFEEIGTGWTKPGCDIYPDSCGDYAGGWFMWAYRDAVQQKGYYQSFENAQNFYQKIVDEINEACKIDKIRCASGLFGFLPKLSHTELVAIPTSLANSYKLLTMQSPINLDAGPSMDANGRLNAIRLFLRNPLTVPSIEENTVRINGWYYDPDLTGNWIKLECTKHTTLNDGLIQRIASPDIAAAMNNSSANQQRFSFNITASDCNECSLTDTTGQRISLEKTCAPTLGAFSAGRATLFIDSVTKATPSQLKKIGEAIKYGLANFYKMFLPTFFWLGLLITAANLLICTITKRMPSPLVICSLAAWALVFTRTVLLVLIDISSFPAINSLYMGPAFPLLIAAILLSIFSFHFSTIFRSRKS